MPRSLKIIKSKTDLGIIKLFSLQTVHMYCEHVLFTYLVQTTKYKIVKIKVSRFLL